MQVVKIHGCLYCQVSDEGHLPPCPSVGLHLDHWTICSGRGGEGLCLPLCHCQCVSGERLTTTVFLSLDYKYRKADVKGACHSLTTSFCIRLAGFVHISVSCCET